MLNNLARMRKTRGATLVETLIAMGILTLAGGLLLALVNGSLNGWSSGASTAYADSFASIAIQKLENDIRDGASASVAGSTLTVTFNATLTDPSNNEVLYSPGGAGTTSTYHLDTTNHLLIKTVSGVNTTLARNVMALSFAGTTAGIVKISIRIDEQIGKVTTQQVDTATVTLRNYLPN